VIGADSGQHPAAVPAPAPAGARDSTVLSKSLLAVAGVHGADARQLARDAKIPGWALADDQAVIPSRHSMRLWELIEWALEDPAVGLTFAGTHEAGNLDLFDYLFTTAATLKEGFQVRADFLHLLTTNSRMGIEAETSQETSFSYRHIEPGDRGEELSLQFAAAILCAQARDATGRNISPVHVAIAAPAPRSHRIFTETFGTRHVDFGAPVTTLAFRAADLELPMRGADPALARILRRHAASLPPPPPATWREHFQQLLAEAIEHGSPSLDVLARRLAVSPRTLQRQLAAHGSTWRSELDTARRRRAGRARQAGATDVVRLARQLGYADPRSVHRTLRRWSERADDHQS